MTEDTKAAQVPQTELLRGVPIDARLVIEVGYHCQNIPYGRMCHEAAATIERLQRELADRDALAERCEKLREALARIGDLCEFTLVRRDFVYGIGQIEGAVQEALTAHMNIASYAGGHGTTGAVDLNGLSQESAVGTAGILAAPKDRSGR